MLKYTFKVAKLYFSMFLYYLTQFITLNLTLNLKKPKNVYFENPEKNFEKTSGNPV